MSSALSPAPGKKNSLVSTAELADGWGSSSDEVIHYSRYCALFALLRVFCRPFFIFSRSGLSRRSLLADELRTHRDLRARAQILNKAFPGLRLALLDQLVFERGLRRFPLILSGRRAADHLEDVGVAIKRQRAVDDPRPRGQQRCRLHRLVEFANGGNRTVGAREIACAMRRELGGGRGGC